MKNTFKKIAATLSAAVMCALPAANALSANATAGSNARYTMRRVYWIDGSANVKNLSLSFTNKRLHCSPATITPIIPGTTSFGGSAGDTYYSCGGSYTANSYFGGPAVSFSVYCDSPSYYGEGNNVYCKAYKANGQQSYNSVHTRPAFLVGDFDGDKDIDGNDYSIIYHAINVLKVGNNYGYGSIAYFNFNNKSYSIPVLQFDINDDGVINQEDTNMHFQYISSTTYRFEK
ncbi:dockerin type I domain-containing protein [uncultured Ruminococcus sp.]|uniref:dockerin type I domain-containing protein n=1 Tax=uncultured Ruminococcus sp. TaxID=165186 RepID=UPI002637D816|nr:dockerin type I domain-containing protein [uncultured Ruminococcus sp.]